MGYQTFLAKAASKARKNVKNLRFQTADKGHGTVTSDFESAVSEKGAREKVAPLPPPGWLKVGAVAAASAVLGGLAAAWFYRKTLSQFREAEEKSQMPGSRTIEDDSPEDF